jgi:hypothetical protein
MRLAMGDLLNCFCGNFIPLETGQYRGRVVCQRCGWDLPLRATTSLMQRRVRPSRGLELFRLGTSCTLAFFSITLGLFAMAVRTEELVSTWVPALSLGAILLAYAVHPHWMWLVGVALLVMTRMVLAEEAVLFLALAIVLVPLCALAGFLRPEHLYRPRRLVRWGWMGAVATVLLSTTISLYLASAQPGSGGRRWVARMVLLEWLIRGK